LPTPLNIWFVDNLCEKYPLPLSKKPPLACDGYPTFISAPNGLRLSRLAGCVYLGSVYNMRYRRHHTPYLLAEGQVGSNRGLGEKKI
jgi:hypothetical protein